MPFQNSNEIPAAIFTRGFSEHLDLTHIGILVASGFILMSLIVGLIMLRGLKKYAGIRESKDIRKINWVFHMLVSILGTLSLFLISFIVMKYSNPEWFSADSLGKEVDNLVGLILDLAAIVLAVFALSMAAMGYHFKNMIESFDQKAERIEKYYTQINENTIASAELLFDSIPSAWITTQIPERSNAALERIQTIMAEHEKNENLTMVSNRAKLKFAQGLHFYVCGEMDLAITQLEEVLSTIDKNMLNYNAAQWDKLKKLKEKVLYRLGICHRQASDVDNSIKVFEELRNAESSERSVQTSPTHSMGDVGKSISLFMKIKLTSIEDLNVSDS